VPCFADNTWLHFRAEKLKITWDNGGERSYDSAEYKKELQETRANRQSCSKRGDAMRRWQLLPDPGSRSEYYVPLLAHAPMEPMVALARIQDGKATIWAPTQNPQAVAAIVSTGTWHPKENVILQRDAARAGDLEESRADYVAEAAVASRKWTAGEGGLDARGRYQV